MIVDEFNKLKNESDDGGTATMTPEQQQWVDTMKNAANAKPQKAPRAPANPCRLFFYNVVTSMPFDSFIMSVIVANVAVMACDYWGIEQTAAHFEAYNSAMATFSYIYYCECVIKLVGLGPPAYFGDAWCRFDFFLVSTSLLDQFAAEFLAQFLPIPPMLLRVLRVLRILRILRLLKGAKDLRDLIVCMILSFPSLVNVCGILALIVFIYAVLGVTMFTFVAHNDNITEVCGRRAGLLFPLPLLNSPSFPSSSLLHSLPSSHPPSSGAQLQHPLQRDAPPLPVPDGRRVVWHHDRPDYGGGLGLMHACGW